jgi:hypothetical protein
VIDEIFRPAIKITKQLLARHTRVPRRCDPLCFPALTSHNAYYVNLYKGALKHHLRGELKLPIQVRLARDDPESRVS